MTIAYQYTRELKYFTVLGGLLFALGCASTSEPQVREYFDEDTVTAIIRAEEPVLFIARRPSLSVVGGDMISVGPVHTIISTDHNQALWLNFWTTIDRFELQVDPFEVPQSVIADADGELIKLDIDHRFAPENKSYRESYRQPSPGGKNGYYRISTAQLMTLAKATDVKIKIELKDGVSTVYQAQSQLAPVLSAFVDYLQ